jgi:RNA polymerase sporulation-specific sigma factor
MTAGDRTFTAEDLADAALVRRAQTGEDRALAEILTKYTPAARATCMRFYMKGAEPDDVIQEGMIGLFKAVRDFDPSRCAKFRVFATICIARQVMTAVKVARRLKHGPLNEAGSLDDPDDIYTKLACTYGPTSDPAMVVTARCDIDDLKDMLVTELSDMEAAALDLYMGGGTYRDIADELGARTKTVDNAIQRVRSKLRTYLSNKQSREFSLEAS